MESNDKEKADESPGKLQDNYIDVQSNKIEKRNKHDGLLEGISDEELDDVSEEENAEKNAKMHIIIASKKSRSQVCV